MSKRDTTDRDGQIDRVRKTLRGRAEKACVRCRAKKRTCDGGNPCQRCKESHSACYFSDWHYTVPYPREYVEYLEEQQEQLSTGLMTMYRLLRESNINTVPPLPDKPQAQELLAALKGLKLDQNCHQRSVSGSIVGAPRDGLRIHGEMSYALAKDRYCEPRSTRSPTLHSSHSPVASSIYASQFGSAPSPSVLSTPATIPSPMQTHYSPVPTTYRPFEFGSAPSTNPQMLAPHHSHHQSLPQVHTGRPQDFIPSSRGGMMRIPEAWNNTPASMSPSLTGSASFVSRPDVHTPLGSSPQHAYMVGPDTNNNGNMQNPWPWATSNGAGMAFYDGQRIVNHNDTSMGLDLASIEQRDGITRPHDTHTPGRHGRPLP